MRATKGGDFKPVPQPAPGTTFARVYSVVDFGHAEAFFKGESNGVQHRIYVTLEMPEFTYVFNEEKGPQPYVVGKEMKLSTHENSALADFVKGMRGFPFTPEEQAGFDPMKLMGRTCLVSFGRKTKQAYANQQIAEFTSENSYLEIVTLAPLPQQIQEMAPMNPQIAFDFDVQMQNQQFDLQTFSMMPKWIRERIEKSDEFKHFASLGQVQVGQEFGSQQAAAPAQQAQPPVQQATQPPVQQSQPNTGTPPAGGTAPTGW